ncbi:hypothetical protein PsYK624_045390 [Phanerochaete sordida]|uniref:Uncharacterized protein n=1 Tax=Phanerochaete sordida TaxID=48140 RepID=A0A9P3G571_9APHY|nr:hypothetical protein PsYK624_045390 [Phanerochaete sordida]
MKPDGHTYPGASTEHDRSLSDENSTAQASTNAPGTAEEEPIVTDESPGTAEDEAPRLRDEIELREALQVAIARLEATEMVGDRPPATRDVVDWILVPREDGSDPIPVFKETILRLWFNDGVDSSLSFDRPRRVRGLSKFGYLLAAVPSDNPTVTRLAHELLHDPHLPPTDSTASTSALHLLPPADTSSTLFPQDIAIVPIRTPDAISLALIKITDIEALGKRVKQVTLQELGRREDKVFVSGQVLVLAREANATAGEGHYFWLWTGEYVQFSHASGKPSKAEDGTRSAYVVRTPGHLVTPVAELMRPSALLAPGSRATLDQLGMPLTYAASDVCLDLLLRQIYSSAQVTAASLLSALPKHGTAKGFPYLGNQGDVRFAMSGIKDAIAQKQGDENEKMSCHQCGTLVKRKELRGHVGTHILRALVGQMEPDLLEQIDLIAHPCGVCGRSGCTVELDGVNAGSSCERFWPFTTGRANKSTNPNPSSNVPIECGLCKPIHPRSKQRPVFWKYNVFLHIRIAHPDQWDTRTRRPFNIHPDFACDMDLKPGELDAVAPSRALPYPQPDPCAPPSPQHSDSRGSRRDAPVHSSSSSHDPAAKHTKLTLY